MKRSEFNNDNKRKKKEGLKDSTKKRRIID